MSANDSPFYVGDFVAVYRSRHGWHDGNLLTTITNRFQTSQGTWKYLGNVDDPDIGSYQIEICHTRDARLIERTKKKIW